MADKDSVDLIKFDGTNYSMWKFGIMFALEAKELISYVDGTKKEPDKAVKPADWQKWKKISSQAAVLLLNFIEKKLHPSLINCQTPDEMWSKISSLYGESSEDAKQNAWEQYYNFRIVDGQAVAPQIEKLESFVKKLEDTGEKLTDAGIMTRLLHSLPSRFSPFRMA